MYGFSYQGIDFLFGNGLVVKLTIALFLISVRRRVGRLVLPEEDFLLLAIACITLHSSVEAMGIIHTMVDTILRPVTRRRIFVTDIGLAFSVRRLATLVLLGTEADVDVFEFESIRSASSTRSARWMKVA